MENRRRFIKKRDIAADLHVTVRTVDRYARDPLLGFPKPVIWNHRVYFDADEFERWKTEQIRASLGTAEAA